jgi:hypothetical protein
MASMKKRIEEFLHSQRGQRLVGRVQDYAERPETRRRIASLRERLTGSRGSTRRPPQE